MSESLYPGRLHIWKNANLSPDERTVEQRFAEQLEGDLEYWFNECRRLYDRTLDSDLARSLSSDWNRTVETRTRYTSAVHNPASAFINELFHRLLTEPAKFGRAAALFMAGGGGSGKTTAVQTVAATLLEGAHLICDTTLSHYESAQEKIQAALTASLRVRIVFVYRPFEQAVRGVVERACVQGRTVPLDVLAYDHALAPQSVLRLARKYENEPNMRIQIIDNSADNVQKARLIPDEQILDFLEKRTHNEIDDMARRAKEILQDEIEKRQKTIHAVPDYVVEALQRLYHRGT